MSRLTEQDIEFHPLSFGDRSVRLFSWEGQLFRAIRGPRADFYRRIMRDGTVESLFDKGLLVETSLSDHALDEYDLVLEHRRIPFVSYAFEWCPEMLRDAALCVLDLEADLAERDLSLRDAHPWNVLFDGVRPQYVDFGSIQHAPPGERWIAYDEFLRFFLHPLLLMDAGRGRVARWLLHDWDLGVEAEDLVLIRETVHHIPPVPMRPVPRSAMVAAARRLLPSPMRGVAGRIVRRRRPDLFEPKVFQIRERREFLSGLRRTVEELGLEVGSSTWSAYYKGGFPPHESPGEWTAKHQATDEVLRWLQPESVLDVGSNRGWFAQLCAERGIATAAFDADVDAVSILHRDAKEKRLNVLPLVMDFRNPSPGYGIGNRVLAPATARLRCSLVMALALVHHLAFTYRLTFDQIAEGLGAFVDRWLLVEFIPPSDRYVMEWMSPEFSWYGQEQFMDSLSRRFSLVKIMPSDPEPRVLMLWERSDSKLSA